MLDCLLTICVYNRDYRKASQLDEQRSKTVNHHKTQIETLSTFSHQIFQELFDDDLAMGRIKLPSSSNNENVRIENATINCLQLE